MAVRKALHYMFSSPAGMVTTRIRVRGRMRSSCLHRCDITVGLTPRLQARLSDPVYHQDLCGACQMISGVELCDDFVHSVVQNVSGSAELACTGGHSTVGSVLSAQALSNSTCSQHQLDHTRGRESHGDPLVETRQPLPRSVHRCY